MKSSRLRFLKQSVVTASALTCFLSDAGTAFATESQANAGWLARQFEVEEQAWTVGSEYFSPTLYNRPIDVTTLDLSRGWRFVNGLEIQLRAGLAHTQGSRSDEPPDGEGRNSTTTGTTGGIGLRYYLLASHPLRLFADVGVQYYWAPRQPFPSGGTAIDGFFRSGAGLSYPLSPSCSLEANWHYAHMSNGGKPPQNPTWEGEGGGLALRFRI